MFPKKEEDVENVEVFEAGQTQVLGKIARKLEPLTQETVEREREEKDDSGEQAHRAS